MKNTLKFLFRYNSKSFKNFLFLLIISNLALAGVTVWEPEVLRFGVNAITQKSSSLLMQTAFQAGLLTIMLIIAKSVVSLCQVTVKNDCRLSLNKRLVEKMVDIEKKEMDRYQFGDISTTIIDNVNKCTDATISIVTDFTAGLGVMLISIIYMSVVEWRLMICIVLYYCVIRLILAQVNKKLKKNAEEVIAADKDGSNLLVSFLSNMINIRVSQNKSFFMEQLKQKETTIMKKNWKEYSWSNGQQDFIWAAAKAAEYLLVYAIGALVLGDIPLGTLFAFIFANDIFNNGIYQFSHYWQNRAKAEACIASINEFLENRSVEIGDNTEYIAPNDFAIRFEDVSFGYNENMVLDKINFTIQHGEKVLIKGGNGQGKSTLLKLICGLYRPSSGTVHYGNLNTATVHIDKLSSLYAYISQNSNILDGDTYQNIAMSKNYNKENINEILENLHIYHCKDTEPSRLSMGEKQRLNISRAFYKSSPIFVLADEMFSNIDMKNRDEILTLFYEKYKKSTVFIITHEDLDYPFDRVLTVGSAQVEEEII